MKRYLTATLALALAACGVWPTAPTGSLEIRNPLYAGGFRTQVIPAGTERLAVLLAAISDDEARPVRLFALDRNETSRKVQSLPAGPLRVVVAALGKDQALAAVDLQTDVVAGETTQVVAELSTDPAVLRALGKELVALQRAPLALPQPSESAAIPTPRPSLSGAPLPTASPIADRTPPPLLPSALPSGFPLIFPSLFPDLATLLGLEEGFGGAAVDVTRWNQQVAGDPMPELRVADGLHLRMAPGTRPGATALLETLSGTLLDSDATLGYTVESWPGDSALTRFGLFVQGGGLVRTELLGRQVYLLFGTDGQHIIPAPPVGAAEQLRLVRRGATLEGFAGTVGNLAPVGRVAFGGGNTTLTVGLRSGGIGPAQKAAQVVVRRIGVRPLALQADTSTTTR